MNEPLLPFCVLGLALAGLPTILVLLTVLVPDYIERAQAVMQQRPWRSFWLGLVNFLFFGGLSLFVGGHDEVLAFLGGFSLVVVLPLLLLAGLLVAAGVVGERIWLHIASRPGRLLGLLRSLMVGILILGLTLLMPLFGWLFFLGMTLTGLGAAIITLRERKRAEPEGRISKLGGKPRKGLLATIRRVFERKTGERTPESSDVAILSQDLCAPEPEPSPQPLSEKSGSRPEASAVSEVSESPAG